MVELRRDCNFDGARLRNNFIFAQQEFLPCGEIFDRHSQHPIQLPVNCLNTRSEF